MEQQMMQSILRSSRSTGTRNPTPGGIPPFSHRIATGIDLQDTAAAANFLAARLIEAWAIEGHSIDAWVIKVVGLSTGLDHGVRTTWTVRTDLVNGMPSGLGRAKWERKYGQGI
jgi:hypothetical protein